MEPSCSTVLSEWYLRKYYRQQNRLAKQFTSLQTAIQRDWIHLGLRSRNEHRLTPPQWRGASFGQAVYDFLKDD